MAHAKWGPPKLKRPEGLTDREWQEALNKHRMDWYQAETDRQDKLNLQCKVCHKEQAECLCPYFVPRQATRVRNHWVWYTIKNDGSAGGDGEGFIDGESVTAYGASRYRYVLDHLSNWKDRTVQWLKTNDRK